MSPRPYGRDSTSRILRNSQAENSSDRKLKASPAAPHGTVLTSEQLEQVVTALLRDPEISSRLAELAPVQSNPAPMKRSYSIAEFAREIGVSYHVVWRKLRAGKIRSCEEFPNRIPASELARVLRESSAD